MYALHASESSRTPLQHFGTLQSALDWANRNVLGPWVIRDPAGKVVIRLVYNKESLL